MKRYRQYIRVSGRHQLKGASLNDQDRANRERVAALGGSIEHTYTEPGRSAFTENLSRRVAFQAMLQDARARRFDVLVVYDLSRFSRYMRVSLDTAAELERVGIEVISSTEHFDQHTAAGRLTFHMLAAAAQFKSDHLSERMRAVRQSEAARGRHVGPIPVGFTRVDGVLVPLEQQELDGGYRSGLGAVREAFRLYATRQSSFEQVSDVLNRSGWRMPSGKHFSKYQVAEMLRNPVYIGLVVCQDQVYNGGHEPVIDREIWDTVQAELARRAAIGDHNHRAGNNPALLSGIARCSNCGSSMWVTGQDRAYYSCSGRLTHAREPRCNLRSVRAEEVHAHVIQTLVHLTSMPAVLDQALAELQKQATRLDHFQPRMDRSAIEAKIKRLARLYEDGLKTDVEYARELASLRQQQNLAEMQTQTSRDETFARANSLLRDVPALLAVATTDEVRTIIQEVFDVIYVRPHHVMAMRPAGAYREMLKYVVSCTVWWAGWGSNPRPSV
ncbi:MAG: recombinase family protein [Roseiflexaceae bacterium]